jgi:hypothetical protein
MATTVLRQSGTGRATFGTWTHTAGAAEETVQVGGYVYDARFINIDSSGEYDANIRYTVSLSGSVSTITIHSQASVTTGRFVIWHAFA